MRPVFERVAIGDHQGVALGPHRVAGLALTLATLGAFWPKGIDDAGFERSNIRIRIDAGNIILQCAIKGDCFGGRFWCGVHVVQAITSVQPRQICLGYGQEIQQLRQYVLKNAAELLGAGGYRIHFTIWPTVSARGVPPIYLRELDCSLCAG